MREEERLSGADVKGVPQRPTMAPPPSDVNKILEDYGNAGAGKPRNINPPLSGTPKAKPSQPDKLRP